jgi:hypothetical protein
LIEIAKLPWGGIFSSCCTYPGAEFVIVGARLDPERELGIELPTEKETPETADVFRKLQIDRRRHPIEPLLKGEWR